GNFQVNNNGNGGEQGDPVLGLVHAGATTGGEPTFTGRDNAYMQTLPDGIPPWSGMFLWEPINDAFEGPFSDGNFDASVIEHEYAHGLSNRYVGQEDNALSTHQSGSMGEGWGDWYALNYLHREELYDKSIVGEFVTGNGERGIRNWSYDDNPVGFGDVGYDTIGAEVHADGEIWTAILWDVRQALVAEFGEAAGSDIAARIVTDAMPLSPNDPSFLDMRDAIVKALDNRFHARPDYPTIFDLVYTEFARRGAGADAATDGGEDIDPTPAFDHVDATRNGVLSGQVVNASTGEPVADARVMIGQFEARVSALRTTGSTGGFSAPAVQGSYPVTIQARGLGSHTFQDVQVTAGETTSLRFELAPNLASEASGAKIVSATSEGAGALLDDTESSSWQSAKGDGNVVIELAKPAEIAAVQVSAFTSSRFEGLRDFTLQVSNDGQVWRTVRSGQGFSYQKPRPVAPDLHYRTFTLEAPVQASHVRFWTDEPFGETKAEVQTGELQVFSETVQGVSPLPPPPPDEPVTDSGTIAAGNPASGSVSGVTASEFEQTCAAPPGSQGTDGWVTTLPDSFGDGMHSVQVKGDSAAPYDLDLYFYDAECNLVGSAASAAADESGTVPSGAKHVLTQLFLGAGVPFDLTATDAGG
ncbi:MAG: M36 family metallopeptidase, partial [Streptomycetales bacterium]